MKFLISVLLLGFATVTANAKESLNPSAHLHVQSGVYSGDAGDCSLKLVWRSNTTLAMNQIERIEGTVCPRETVILRLFSDGTYRGRMREFATARTALSPIVVIAPLYDSVFALRTYDGATKISESFVRNTGAAYILRR